MAKKVEITVGQVYQNRKNPKRVGTVVRATEHPDAITLKLANGDLPTVTREGLSKGWKRIEDAAPVEETVEAVAEPTEESNNEKQFKKEELDTSKYEKQKKEKKQKQEKPVYSDEEKPKKKREHKPKNSPEVIDALIAHILDYTEKLGGDCGVPRDADMKFRALRKQGRQFCKLMWSGKSVKLFSKVATDYQFKTINYALPNQYDFVNTEEATFAAIDELLSASYNECAVKITRKKKEDK